MRSTAFAKRLQGSFCCASLRQAFCQGPADAVHTGSPGAGKCTLHARLAARHGGPRPTSARSPSQAGRGGSSVRLRRTQAGRAGAESTRRREHKAQRAQGQRAQGAEHKAQRAQGAESTRRIEHKAQRAQGALSTRRREQQTGAHRGGRLHGLAAAQRVRLAAQRTDVLVALPQRRLQLLAPLLQRRLLVRELGYLRAVSAG